MSTLELDEVMLADHTGRQTFNRHLLHYLYFPDDDAIQTFLPKIGKESGYNTKVDSFGRTLLHYAAEYDNGYMARYLVNEGYDLHAVDHLGLTPLQIALKRKYVGVLCLFAREIDQVFIDDEIGKTWLRIILSDMWPCKYCPRVLIPKLKIKSGDDIELANILIAEKCDLCYAVCIGKISMVKKMLDHGFSVKARDGNGNNALIMALLLKHTDIVNLLLEYDFDPNIQNVKDSTALHWAVRLGQIECVKILLERGAKVNIQDKLGDTALHMAIRLGQLETTILLLNNGANVNVQNKKGKIPLNYSKNPKKLYTTAEQREILKLLLERGSDVSLLDCDNRWQIYDLVRAGSKEAIEILLNSSAVISARDHFKKTILHNLVKNRNASVYELINSQNFDLNVRDEYGRTPLHLAIRETNEIACKFLLKIGADVNATMNNSETSLFYAVRHVKSLDKIELIELLLENGAELQFLNNRGLSIFHCIKYFEVFEYMLNHLASIESFGTTVIKSIRECIEFSEKIKADYDLCKNRSEKIIKDPIYSHITLFKLLTEDERKVVGYLRNDEVLSKVKSFGTEFHFNPYCNKLFNKRITDVIQLTEMVGKAEKKLYKIINSIIRFNSYIVYEITSYLDRQDLKNLINV